MHAAANAGSVLMEQELIDPGDTDDVKGLECETNSAPLPRGSGRGRQLDVFFEAAHVTGGGGASGRIENSRGIISRINLIAAGSCNPPKNSKGKIASDVVRPFNFVAGN